MLLSLYSIFSFTVMAACTIFVLSLVMSLLLVACEHAEPVMSVECALATACLVSW